MPSKVAITIAMMFVVSMCLALAPRTTFSNTGNLNTNGADGIKINEGLEGTSDSALNLQNKFSISASTSGVLDPVLVEQSGYYDTGVINGRTDTGKNASTDLPINNASNWVASNAEAKLWDIKREFAENGTFDEGTGGTNTYPDVATAHPTGWGVDWYDSSGGQQNLYTSYDNNSKYVTVESQGEEDTTPSITYIHYDGTYVLWNQTIQNTPYSDNMTLRFRYNYVSGIIDKFGVVPGYALLVAFIENSTNIWPYIILDLTTDTPARNTWYDAELTNITDAPSTFVFSLGLYILASNGDSFVLNPGADYDNDGNIDGALARTFEVQLDDVSLVGVSPPSFDQVDLSFHAGSYSTPFTSVSSSGSASINYNYWNTSTINVGISANVSVSFEYEVWLLSHYFSNSSETTHPTEKGVAYTIDTSHSADLSTFTYIGSDLTATYENFSVFIYIPSDWENATVFDPFTNEVSSACTVDTGLITIPTSLLTRLGWWEIDFQAFNYAKSTTTQIYDSEVSNWSNNTLFRSTNITRAVIEIGRSGTVPVISTPVNASWIMPSGYIWSEQSISNGVGGVVNTARRTLGPSNTTAGLWSFQFAWTNGTEIAYGSTSFEVHHQASISAYYDPIDINTGLSVSNWVFLKDNDTGDFLLDDSVAMVANWSDSVVTFTANHAKTRWEATFDTKLVGAGEFTVVVNASRPYFDNVSCSFTVISTFTTQLEFPDVIADHVDSGLNEIYNLGLQYTLSNGTGIVGAAISFSYTGPGSGLVEGSQSDLGLGNYSLEITGVLSGEYQVTISCSKAFHEAASKSFTLVIGETGASLTSLNGSAALVECNHDYRLVLSYSNSTGSGLPGATLQVIETTPSLGLVTSTVSDIGSGLYSVTLTPSVSQTYSIVIKANLTNHQTQYLTFTLLASDVQTSLIANASSATISVDQIYVLRLTYEDGSSNPVVGASISIVAPPSDLDYSVLEIGGGVYDVTLTPLVSTSESFQLSFRANKTAYQSSVVSFVLQIQEIPTDIVVLSGETSQTIMFTEQYQIDICFVRTDTNENITGADVTPVAAPADGLSWTIDAIGDFYRVTFDPHRIGAWQITLTANKTLYVRQNIQLDLKTDQIGTSLNDISLVESLVYGRTYNFTFNYLMFNGTRVLGAAVASSVTGNTSVVTTQEPTGEYRVALVPGSVGSFEITLEFDKTGYASQTTTLSFTVVAVKVSVADLQGLNGLEGQLTLLSMRLVETDTGKPVSGATVAFQIVTAGIPGSRVTLEESEAGMYSKSFVMPNSDINSKIRIYVYMDNHEMSGDQGYAEATLTPTVSEATLITRTITQWSPLIVLGFVASVGYEGRRRLHKKQRRRNLEALAIKRRFDDVRNIVGVVVLHRESGIPVYSRMLREGFDDSLISAFITAISQFRSEFDVDQKEWVITPISDIIMAVRTQNLVCAFITMGPPTSTQEERMIQFAKSVGFVFDSNFEEAPILTIDDVTEDRFDELFDELLDMNLHQKHKIVDTKGLPKKPKCLNNTIAELRSSEGFELEDMADRMAACGIEEARAYKIILDAIHNGQLVPIGRDDYVRDSPGDDAGPEKDMDTAIVEDIPEKSMHEDEVTDRDKFVDDIESLLKAEKDEHEDRTDDDPV